MDQISTYNYDVNPNEWITLKAELTNVSADRVSVSHDGNALPNLGGAIPTFQFAAPSQEGAISVVTVGVSFNGSAPNARCTLTLEGSEARTFHGPEITPQSAIKTVNITFATRIGGPR